jgi:GPH family glycoside/pentoside/hexuronide:cation symporter
MNGIKDDLPELLNLGKKVSLKEKISLTFGQFAMGNIDTVLAFYLFIYYTQFLGLELELWIMVNLIFIGYNALNDFLFGYYADFTKHKLGRRIPYLRYLAIPFGISFAIFWIPMSSGQQTAMFLQLLIVYFIYDTFRTIIGLSFNSLPPEMTESTTERNNISLFITLGQFGSAISVLITPVLFNLGLNIFRIGTMISAAISSITYLVVSYTIKERTQLYASDDFNNRQFKKEFIQTFKNPSFLSIILFNFCISSLWPFINNYSRIYGYIFGIDNGELLVSGINYFSFFLSMMIVIYLGKMIEGRRIIIKLSILCISGISILFLIDLIFNLTAVFFIIIAFNGFLTGAGIFSGAFMGDAIDQNELKTGKRRESMHMAINALFSVPTVQIIAILVGTILLIFNYNQAGTAIEQPSEAIIGLKLLLTFVPIMFASLLLVSQKINPLHGEKYKDFKLKILKLHSEKEGKNFLRSI